MLDLRDFQAIEVEALLRGSRLLAWKPGVGKTLPLVRAAERLGLPALWITLAALREQAARVMIEERSDNPRVQVVRSGADEIDPRADVVIVSYDMMRDDWMWRRLFKLSWGAIVCDEAHALKNSGSVRTRAFYGARLESKGALFRRAPLIWLATGTPLLSDPMDLWPHVSRLWPHELPAPQTKDGWMAHHCITRPGGYGEIVVGARRPDELRALLNRVGSVRELDLDVRLDVDDVRVEISAAERERIEASVSADEWHLIEALFADIDGGAARERMQEQARLLPINVARRVLGLAKARPVADMVAAELDGGLEQCIVWGWHREALSVVVERLAKYGSVLLNGDVSRSDRDARVRDFVSGKARVIVANLDVAGVGLDGLQCSHRCILMEPDWLPGKNTQAIARQFRQGQRHPVHATLVAVARSPDEIITRVLTRRARMIEQSTGASA